MSDVIVGPHVELLMPHRKQEPGRQTVAQCMGWWQIAVIGFMCVSTTLHISQHLQLKRLNNYIAQQDEGFASPSKDIAHHSEDIAQQDEDIAQQNQGEHSVFFQVLSDSNEPRSREKRHVVSDDSSTQNPLSSPVPHRHRYPYMRRMMVPVTTVDHFDGSSVGESNHHDQDADHGIFKQWDKAHWSTGNTTYDKVLGRASIKKTGIYLIYAQITNIPEIQADNNTEADDSVRIGENPPTEGGNARRNREGGGKWARFLARHHNRWTHMASGFKVMRQRYGRSTSKAILECKDSIAIGFGRLSRPCVGITTATLGKGDWLWIENAYGARTIDTHRASTHWGLIYQGPSQ